MPGSPLVRGAARPAVPPVGGVFQPARTRSHLGSQVELAGAGAQRSGYSGDPQKFKMITMKSAL
eukprot:5107322-Prymnesium_polylepis.2